MKKGVDAAVATILLLMITISLIGFAFVWFNRLAVQSSQAIENQTLEAQKKSAMRIKLLSASGNEATVQNIGSETIPAGAISVFVKGKYAGNNTAPLAPNGVTIITLTQSCSSGEEVKATAPGNDDYITCE